MWCLFDEKLANDQKTVETYDADLKSHVKGQRLRLTKIDTDRTFVYLVSHDCIIVIVILLEGENNTLVERKKGSSDNHL